MKMAVLLSTDRNFIKLLPQDLSLTVHFASVSPVFKSPSPIYIITWKMSEIDPVSDGQLRLVVLCNRCGSINPAVSGVFTFLSSVFPF